MSADPVSPPKFKVLFVCLGNICRSPAAEGVLQALIARENQQDRIAVDSAGTGGWHAGALPDPRMRRHAAARGYDLASRARQVRTEDFAEFDLILAMDRDNLRDLRGFARNTDDMKKVRLFCEFTEGRPESEVPDPYYGGEDGFETVLDLVENGSRGILKYCQDKLPA